MSETPALHLENISKHYESGESDTLSILDKANCVIKRGEIVGLIAPSGTGKSTILHIAGLLDTPDNGRVSICGEDVTCAPDRDRTRLRRHKIGFVYQFHHLLNDFTAQENIAIPMIIYGIEKREALRRAKVLLGHVHLEDRATFVPGRMSGGERQRVAIMRSLANNPDILLADEPTGNLDMHNARSVFKQLISIVRERKMAVLVATHNDALLPLMDRIITLRDKKIVAVRNHPQ